MRSTRTFGDTMFDAIFFNVRAFYQKKGNTTPEVFAVAYVTLLQGIIWAFFSLITMNVFFDISEFADTLNETYSIKFKYLPILPGGILYLYNYRKYLHKYKAMGYENLYSGKIWNIKTWLFPILMAVVPIAVFAMGIVLLELTDTLHE